MTAPKIIDVTEQDGSQVVVLPPDVRLPNGQVEVVQSGDTVTLRPIQTRKAMTKEEFDTIFAKIHRLTQGRFMEDGREQPPMPSGDHIVFK